MITCVISVFIGLILIITGIILYLFAERIPRNLLFGFRIGYTLSSKKLWVKYNRLSGIVLVFIGLVTLFLPLFISNIMVLILILLGLIIVSTITLTYMASREAKQELSFETVGLGVAGRRIWRIMPVKPSPLRIILAVLPPLLSIILTLYLLPYLPNLIPVHYDISGAPNRWDTLNDFLKITFPFIIGIECLPLIFMLVEIKAPMIFYAPRLPKKKFVNLLYDIGIMMAWLVMLVYIDILYYAINNKHIIPMTMFTVLILIVVAIILVEITWLTIRWKKNWGMLKYNSYG
ncbi:SdpI family protein [Staphylothermus hellenicus]|nr:SdpI family protein [Staphylothermus hellenicus]